MSPSIIPDMRYRHPPSEVDQDDVESQDSDDSDRTLKPSNTSPPPEMCETSGVLDENDEVHLREVIDRLKSVKVSKKISLIEPLPVQGALLESDSGVTVDVVQSVSKELVEEVQQILKQWITWKSLEYILGSREELVKMIKFYQQQWRSEGDLTRAQQAEDVLENLPTLESKQEDSAVSDFFLQDEFQIRRSIASERLQKFSKPFFLVLKVEEGDVWNKFRMLISSLAVDARSVGQLKPAQWEMLSVLIFKAMSVSNVGMQKMLQSKRKDVQQYLKDRFDLDFEYLSRFQDWLLRIDGLLEQEF